MVFMSALLSNQYYRLHMYKIRICIATFIKTSHLKYGRFAYKNIFTFTVQFFESVLHFTLSLKLFSVFFLFTYHTDNCYNYNHRSHYPDYRQPGINNTLKYTIHINIFKHLYTSVSFTLSPYV